MGRARKSGSHQRPISIVSAPFTHIIPLAIHKRGKGAEVEEWVREEAVVVVGSGWLGEDLQCTYVGVYAELGRIRIIM